MEWRLAGLSVCLPLLISPCTIKSRSSLLAPAHPGCPGKRAVKRLCVCVHVKLAAHSSLITENTGHKMMQKNRHLGTIPQRCRAISSQRRHVSTIGKNLLSSNISSTVIYNMVNFGVLAAEIVSLVWGTPANFNGFRFLAALLDVTPVLGVSQTLRH